MRKTLTALLLLTLVVLPGCVFAYGTDDGWDHDDSHSARIAKLEKRVAALEQDVAEMQGR